MIPRFLLVTGTDTGVGKTIATAALAATLRAAGRRVIMCKPIQTGHISPDDPQREHLEADYSDVVTESDAQIVARLTGIHTFTNITLRLPMAPLPAARLEVTGSVSATAGAASILPSAAEHAQLIATVAERTRADHVLIEGSGGVLVDFGGHTAADILACLSPGPDSVGAVIVSRSRLGTLNHAALTAEALGNRHISVTGIIMGSWPEPAPPVDRDNRCALSAIAPILGAVPAGAGHRLGPGEFTAQAPGWLHLPW
ncbi:dethiobiotin synthase [Brevibacterium aurantiacum]|uniref:dethiobiotin synthase n=1 Tax=Brevibacterium aurantiacum TaxID=273384 RepID=UPI001867DDD7|nr:dethiobiotin synthase [Brevibacterium aurantiacum]